MLNVTLIVKKVNYVQKRICNILMNYDDVSDITLNFYKTMVKQNNSEVE
jgi:hypothetical protein